MLVTASFNLVSFVSLWIDLGVWPDKQRSKLPSFITRIESKRSMYVVRTNVEEMTIRNWSLNSLRNRKEILYLLILPPEVKTTMNSASFPWVLQFPLNWESLGKLWVFGWLFCHTVKKVSWRIQNIQDSAKRGKYAPPKIAWEKYLAFTLVL